MAEKQLHVVMIPWSAFGHMMPFYQLSIALAKAGIHVSFISTPRNIQRLPKLPSNSHLSIDLVSLPFPFHALSKGLLPDGAEATVDIPFEKIQYLKTAYDHLRHPVKEFVTKNSPDYLIVDVMPHWAVDIAREHNVKLVFFSVFSALTVSFIGPPDSLSVDDRPSPESLMYSPEWVTFDSTVAFTKYEAIGTFGALFGSNGTDMSDAERIAKILEACQAVAIRACNEYENQYLNLLTNLLKKPVIPTGLLPPEKPEGNKEVSDGEWGEIFEWLNQKEPKSVVFVGFGSECKLSREQVHEIAHGLQLSDLPFVWALRKPSWAENETDALPSGFTDFTSKRGLVCMGWAPQMEILSHPSIGGSLFHSGWGSVIETLQFGHCLVVLPFIIDQPLNARLLVEKGLAVEIERGEDGSFSRFDIAKALRLAMVSKEGERLRAKARKAALVFGDGKLHEEYIVGFVDYLKNGAMKHVK